MNLEFSKLLSVQATSLIQSPSLYIKQGISVNNNSAREYVDKKKERYRYCFRWIPHQPMKIVMQHH